ncbi:UNVERIFIED_CONTAM: hypothetical protein NCL1_03811 [Trichonephila clavipes]
MRGCHEQQGKADAAHFPAVQPGPGGGALQLPGHGWPGRAAGAGCHEGAGRRQRRAGRGGDQERQPHQPHGNRGRRGADAHHGAASPGGVGPASGGGHRQVGDRPRAHRRRSLQDRPRHRGAVQGRRVAARLRRGAQHLRPCQRDAARRARRFRPLRCQGRLRGHEGRQLHRPRVRGRHALADHLHDGRSAFDLAHPQRHERAALAGARRRPRAQHRRAADLHGAGHRGPPHRLRRDRAPPQPDLSAPAARAIVGPGPGPVDAARAFSCPGPGSRDGRSEVGRRCGAACDLAGAVRAVRSTVGCG